MAATERTYRVESPHPMDSDGSDYEMEESEDDSSDDELGSFAPGEIPQPDVPPPPQHHDMNVEKLLELFDQQKQARTLGKFLLSIDVDDDRFGPIYSNITDLDGEDPRLVCKVFGSPLHWACMDLDGCRGEEKIRTILQAAEQARISMASLLCRNQIYFHQRPDGSWADHGDSGITPLQCLISNPYSSVESLRMLCEAWPQGVHLRDTVGGAPGTLLIFLIEQPFEAERHLTFFRVLLEVAEKTREGAIGLVSATDTIHQGLSPIDVPVDEDIDAELTALHTITGFHQSPELLIPLLLKVWPDALKYCRDGRRYPTSTPLHNVARYISCYVKGPAFKRSLESRIKSIEAFFSGSSLEGLAAGLLYTDYLGDLGFHVVMAAIEEMNGKDCFQELQAHMQASIEALVRRKDQHGRNFLHYVAANPGDVNDAEFKEKAKKIQAGAEGVDTEDWDAIDLMLRHDPTDEVSAMLQEEQARLEKRNQGHIIEVCRWILSMVPSSSLVYDSEGMNPFHFAISKRKKWTSGLQDLALLVPDWRHSRNKITGLFPFMSAALPQAAPGNDISTIYEILRFDVSLMQQATGGTWKSKP